MNRHDFFVHFANKLSVEGLQCVQTAYWLVKDAHRKQSRRLTGERYFEHVRRVAYSSSSDFGFDNHTIVVLSLFT